MRRFLIAASLILWFAPALGQAPGTNRVVAIGDIHGAYDEFTEILARAGLVNEKLAWSGGRATLVQTGDYTDRGAGVRPVMDLLMRLEREAKRAGGQVVTLLGNHEVMNLIGDWRDVTPEICATFAKSGADDGCVAYRQAMSPRGAYGRWLRDKHIAAKVGDTLFMHAGINPARPAPRSIDEVNSKARAEIRRLDQYRQRLVRSRLADDSATLQQVLDVTATELQRASEAIALAKAEGTPLPELDVPLLREAQQLMDIATWSLVDPEGPMWFRGYAQWDEAATTPQVFGLLDALKVTRIVVGHSVTADRKIATRFGGRVYLIDTGMLASAYKGTPSALEISGGSVKPIYTTGAVSVPQ
ncbi:MAG TPA: metallophosphoesterase [Vicinamibacterales bacterium]|nr:metallophosphoesterase [Vicinamibacterales bacterium]